MRFSIKKLPRPATHRNPYLLVTFYKSTHKRSWDVIRGKLSRQNMMVDQIECFAKVKEHNPHYILRTL